MVGLLFAAGGTTGKKFCFELCYELWEVALAAVADVAAEGLIPTVSLVVERLSRGI